MARKNNEPLVKNINDGNSDSDQEVNVISMKASEISSENTADTIGDFDHPTGYEDGRIAGKKHTILTDDYDSTDQDDDEYILDEDAEESEYEYSFESDVDEIDKDLNNLSSLHGTKPTIENTRDKLGTIHVVITILISMIVSTLMFRSGSLDKLIKPTGYGDLASRIKSLEHDSYENKAQIQQLSETSKIFEKTLEDTTEYLMSNQNSMEQIKQQVRDTSISVNHNLNQIEELRLKIGRLENMDYLEKKIIEAVSKVLPEKVVASFDAGDGSIKSNQALIKMLLDHFSGGDHHAPDSIKKLANQALNEEASETQNQSVFVTKDMFKRVLKHELESIRFEIAKELSKTDQKLYEDIKNIPATGGVPLDEVLTNGTIVALNTLIKTSIQRYVSHTISKPDFVDISSGAQVIWDLTSNSYDWKAELPPFQQKYHNILSAVGFGRMKVNSPLTAFSNDVSLGSCWPFNGKSGQVAMSLEKLIKPTDLGVVHVRADQSPNPKSAPRHISLYIEIESESEREHIEQIISDNCLDIHDKNISKEKINIPESFVKIISVEYNIYSSADEFQVFPIPEYITSIPSLKTSKVIFLIEDNWGHEDFTCVYRFRLFGELLDNESLLR